MALRLGHFPCVPFACGLHNEELQTHRPRRRGMTYFRAADGRNRREPAIRHGLFESPQARFGIVIPSLKGQFQAREAAVEPE